MRRILYILSASLPAWSEIQATPLALSGYTAYRVEQLEKKVETHNSFAARIPLLERDINEVKAKISELERKIGRS